MTKLGTFQQCWRSNYWFDRAEKAAGPVPVRELPRRREPIHAQNSDRPSKPRTERVRSRNINKKAG